MPTTSLKILVAGDVKGNYCKFFKRVKEVNQKAGPFDLLFCIGDFFGEEIDLYNQLLDRLIEAPTIPVYILGPIPKEKLKPLHSNVEKWEAGFELVDGITFLGKSGILTTTQNVRVAYLNGSYDGYGDVNDPNMHMFNDRDYESLLVSHQSSASSVIDILLTTQWPTGIFNYTSVPDDIGSDGMNKIDEQSSMMISRLSNALQPRYHFAGGVNLFYERTPFRNHRVMAEQTKNVTRFISIAMVANKEKQKWLYAFNCVPAKDMTRQELVTQPDSITDNPFQSFAYKNENSNKKQDGDGQFFYDLGHQSGQNDHSFDRKRKNDKNDSGQRQPKRLMQVDQQNCWFCLASPNVDKSLIVSIGEHSYLALAKGGLTDKHMMILPIEHFRSTIEADSSSLKNEIDKFKVSITNFFKSCNLVPVFFERNFKSAHFQLQIIPLPMEKKDQLKQAIDDVFGQFECHQLSDGSQLEDVVRPGLPYFYLECPGVYKFFVKIDVRKSFFPIQIGRELLAHKDLLDCNERIDWKACVVDENESKELTKSIRQQFKPFDFTL